MSRSLIFLTLKIFISACISKKDYRRLPLCYKAPHNLYILKIFGYLGCREVKQAIISKRQPRRIHGIQQPKNFYKHL